MNPQPTTDTAPYLFSARELARLAVYRAAVVARFYTDQLDRPTAFRTRDAVRLVKALQPERQAA